MPTYRHDKPIYQYLYERPSAQAFGVGQCIVGGVEHTSDGIKWLSDRGRELKNRIGIKLPGTQASIGGPQATWCLKIAVPAHFDSVQLVLQHSDPSAATTYSAIVAVTETASQSSDTNRWRPVIDGTERSTLLADSNGTDNLGWLPIKWSGAADITPAGATALAPNFTLSDKISLQSVERGDGGNANYKLLLCRINATGGATSYTGVTTNMYTETAANGGQIIQAGYFTDGTGLMVSAPATNNPSGAGTGAQTLPVGFIFDTLKPSLTLMTVGDSMTQGSSTIPDLYSSLGHRAAASVTAAGIQCGHVNAGGSGQKMHEYTPSALSLISLYTPDVVLVQGFSRNGPYLLTTDNHMRNTMRRQSGYIRAVQAATEAYGGVVILSTGVPCKSADIATAQLDLFRLAHNDRLRLNKYCLDFDALVSNQASPARIAAAYDYGDAVHPNEAAVNLEGIMLADKIKGIF